MRRIRGGGVLSAALGMLLVLTVPSLVTAQPYTPVLPPGVLSVSISAGPGGQQTASLGLNQTPVVNSTTPVFSGRLEPGITQAEFAVFSTPIRWIVPVDPVTGTFETMVPVALEPGVHSLYINNAFVGRFIVPEGAGPTVPGVPAAVPAAAVSRPAAPQPAAPAAPQGPPAPLLPRTGSGSVNSIDDSALPLAGLAVVLALVLVIPIGRLTRWIRSQS